MQARPLARWRRRLAILGVIVVLALIALRSYLRSDAAARLVAAELGEILETSVSITSLQGKLVGHTVALGVKLYNDGEDRPYLEADKVVVDISVANAAGGKRLPDLIDLHGVRMHLRFSRDGALRTKLPTIPQGGNLPALHLRDLTLTLDQEGREPLTLRRASLLLSPDKEENLAGVLDDPVWGKFAVAGRFGGGKVHLRLTTGSLTVTPAMFRSVPFIPTALTRQMEVEGDIPLELGLWFRRERPQARYRVTFANARVRLLQPDRPAFVTNGARGTIDGTDEGFAFQGEVRDPRWGDWTVAADLGADDIVRLRLDTASVSVEPAKLAAMPYVPKGVWDHIQATGKTSAQVRVHIPINKPDLHYRVELAPSHARLRVAVLDLEASDASGRVVVEDNLVTFRDVHGTTAGGTIAAEGEMDFRRDPIRMRFGVDAARLRMTRLPAKWELPRQLDGVVTGKANLSVTTYPEGVETRGTGAGRIDEASLAGFRTAGPIPLRLHANGTSIRFLPGAAWLEAILSGIGAAPGRSRILEVVDRLTERVEEAGRALVRRAGFAAVLRGETTYLDASLALEDVDVGELLRRLGVRANVDLAGRGAVRLRVGVPVNNTGDLRLYRLSGKFAASDLRLASVRLDRAEARFGLDRGMFRVDPRVEENRGGQGAGAVCVALTSADGSRGNVSAEVCLDGWPIESLDRLLPATVRPVSGRVSGRASIHGPLANLRDPRTWHGAATLHAPAVELAGVSLRDVGAVCSLHGGMARVTELRAEALGGVLSGSLAISLGVAQTLTGTLRARGVDPALFPGLRTPLPIAGAVDLTGEIAAKLRPWSLTARGMIHTPALRASGVRLERLSASWLLDSECLQVKEVRGRLHGGSVTGWGRLGLADLAGQSEFFVSDVDASELTKALGQPARRVEGRVSGQIGGRFRFGGTAPEASFQADLASPRVSVFGVAAQDLRGRIDGSRGTFNYQLTADVLAGRLSVEGTYPPPAQVAAGKPHGVLRLERSQLDGLWEAMGQRERLGGLRGVVAVSLPYRHDGPGFAPTGRGRFEVRDLRLNDAEVMELLRGEVHLRGDGISLRDIGGMLAGGSLRISGGLRFDDLAHGWFDVRLLGAEATRLPVPAPELKALVQGPIDLSLRGNLGVECRAAGAVSLRRGKLAGVEVGDWRLPLEITFAPATGHAEVAVRESTAQVGAGRAHLRASLRRGDGWRVEGQLLFFDASLSSLAGLLGDATSLARGRVTGRIDFSGAEMRSLTDLNATVQAKLNDAQALQLPILRLLVPHVLPSQGALSFQAGELSGRLAGGVFRISRLTLDSSLLLVLVQGNVTLQGRLDLDAIAQTTAPGGNSTVFLFVLQRLPPIGPVPVALLAKATELLSDRVVQLRIGGSFRAPQVRVEPIRLLSEEAVRYFLSRAVSVPWP